MTGLDTNVLLGWMLQGQAVTLPKDKPYMIAYVVLAELVWVLRGSLKRPKAEIVSTLKRIVDLPDISLPDRTLVSQAVTDYESGSADFSDYLINRCNETCGCKTTYTFDRKAARESGFTLLN